MSSIRIYLSYDRADAHTAADLKRQLTLAYQPGNITFRDKDTAPSEVYRSQAKAFLEQCQLFIAITSMNYEDHPDTRWEAATAVELQQQYAKLQLAVVPARFAPIPAVLKYAQLALPFGETIENQNIPRDKQLLHAVKSCLRILASAPKANEMPSVNIELPLGIEDLRERLLAQTDRINHAPLIALLKRIIEDVQTKRIVLDVEEGFRQLREQTSLGQITMAELEARSAPRQNDLYQLILNLKDADLSKDWPQIFIRDYFQLTPGSREQSQVPPFFTPCDEVLLPETLNLPVGPTEQEALEQTGLLSFEQKSDFRRSLLLAKDALAIHNYAGAYNHCDHVRQHIDPQSAQLYELLLITYVQKETPMRIMQEAVRGNARPLDFVLLFASRYREYQQAGKCTSTTAPHNLAIASEALSDAALRLYHQYPNDSVLDTGKHAEAIPDARRELRIILGNTLKVCRLVHPSEELLEAAIIECCGGGKCHWLKKVEVAGEYFRFTPDGHFDLLGEIHELVDMIQGMEADQAGKIVKDRAILREDLWLALLAKRQKLVAQLEEDQRRQRPYTDERASVLRFVQTCLLGAEIFTEKDVRGRAASFYRLALSFLLPDLVTDSHALPGNENLRWFDFDANGQMRNHPDCAAYDFNAHAIVEKIVKDIAGTEGLAQVMPNIRESAWLQYVRDTEKAFLAIQKELSYTDFRRPDDMSARRQIIYCLRRWKIAWKAYPERSQHYLDQAIAELTGDGLMLWMHHNPEVPLVTHADSLALEYDAISELKSFLEASTRYDEMSVRERIAEQLFQRRILKQYEAIKPGEKNVGPLATILRETLANYRLHPDPKYLDLVWRELTEEVKTAWVDINDEGQASDKHTKVGFSALDTALTLAALHPDRYRMYDFRSHIAAHRHHDQMDHYFAEISEFRQENRRPERGIAVGIIRRMKGIFHYFPKEEFLELPLRELEGRGRVRWHANFLGVLPTRENHYENQFFKFNYRFELFEVRRLLQQQYEMLRQVMIETGEI